MGRQPAPTQREPSSADDSDDSAETLLWKVQIARRTPFVWWIWAFLCSDLTVRFAKTVPD